MPTVRNLDADDGLTLVKFKRPFVQHGIGTKASQCDGKRSFSEFKVAEVAAKRRKKRQVYRCRYCRMWHVGTRG